MFRIRHSILTFLIIITFSYCGNESKNVIPSPAPLEKNDPLSIDTLPVILDTTNSIITLDPDTLCIWDEYLTKHGLADIQIVDSTLLVDLKYSTTDNFMNKDMYGCLNRCYLQPDVAEKLKVAQAYLKKKDSTLSLLIYDGVRPRSVQQYMWDILDMPINEKTKFVSNPKRGSLHNFGAAVDITLADAQTGIALDMGTPYDYIGILAWPIKEKLMLEDSLLTQDQVDNRKLLRSVMMHGGFFNIQSEWWHFNSCYRDSAQIKYQIVEGLDSLTLSIF